MLAPTTIQQDLSIHSSFLLSAMSASQSRTPSQKRSSGDQEVTARLLTAGFQVSCASSH